VNEHQAELIFRDMQKEAHLQAAAHAKIRLEGEDLASLRRVLSLDNSETSQQQQRQQQQQHQQQGKHGRNRGKGIKGKRKPRLNKKKQQPSAGDH
jgi:hypothetical protein